MYPPTVFGAADRLVAGLLQTHLHAAWQRVQNRPAAPAGLDSDRITLNAQFQPHHLTARQCALLHAYFPRWRGSATLPVPLREWVRSWLRHWDAVPSATARHSFKAHSARGRLLIRCFPPAAGKPPELLLLEVPNSMLDHRVTASLSSREREVLHWIAQGKRDAEIAVILGTAPATISKHVENILRKLHAGTRLAAVSLARERAPF
jgi:DNA-binding CsgD family transcriptional regulator